MKNLFKSIMIVAAAAMSFASCSNNFTEEAVSGEKIEINVNATNDEITRSAFGEPSEGSYPTLWDGKENFVMNANDSNGDTTVNVTAKFSTDFRTVNLSANFEFDAPQTSYTAYAMVPKSACVFAGITANKGWQVTIPTAQTTGANSCDPAAQILMGASETKTSATEAFNMTFKHAVAYGKMTLTNLNLGDATISSVAIESTKNIAGRFYINHKTLAYSDNSGAKSITINTTSSDNIWFALAPVDVSNTTLKIVVNTNKGTFTKQVTMPANRKFELGKISIFKVDMTGIAIVAPVQYTLLTDVANLKVGDEIVIAAKDANFAVSSTQNTNNRGQAAITKSSDKSTISDPGSAVEIFTVEAGSTSGTFAFKAQKYAGYIYAASSGSNHMKTQATKDANASWTISVTTAGVATIKAQGTNTRNWLRYNEQSTIFSCYGSGQKDVVIYHLAATPADPNAPSIVPADEVLEIEADEIYAETAVTLNNITEEVVVNCTEDWIDDALVEDYTLYITATKNETTVARQAVFTISANGVEAKVTLKQKGVQVTPEPGDFTTIAQVLALGNGVSIPSGTIIEGVVISNMELNNLTSKKGMYIQDATGGLQLRFSADHTFAYGTKLQINLSGRTIGAYNGSIQIDGITADMVTTVSTGNTVEPKTVTMADFLANKYEGQYVAIEGVQVASADLAKTWVMGGAHTSINMEDAAGNKFIVFSSKYATYGTQTVAQGSGTIKGISAINNGTMQIIFTQASDFAGLTGTRFNGAVTPDPDPTPDPEIAAITIADFLKKEVNATTWFKLTGTISNISNTTYGNFDITDETGTILVYGLTKTKQSANDKSFSTIGLKEGDIVTLIGTRAAYYATPQVGGPAYYVSHVAGTAPKPETGDATLSFANKAQRTVFTTTQQVWEQNGITLTNDKASSTNDIADYAAPVRFYQNSAITVSAASNIAKIVFDCNNSSYATALKNSIGTTNNTVTVSSDKVTVVLATPATSFAIAKLTAQVRMDSLIVTYAE